MSMKLFGEASRYVDFSTSIKNIGFTVDSKGTKYGTLTNNEFKPYKIFTSTFDPMSLVPLTLEAMEDGVIITFRNRSSNAVSYKINGNSSGTINSNNNATIQLLHTGDVIQFYGSASSYSSSKISCNGDCYIYGNIMSLINGDNFENLKVLESSGAFSSLFSDNEHIKNKNSANLVLPATTITECCYQNMFFGCTGLTKAPALPATILANNCYEYMFQNCSSLTTAPDLPATTLADDCYDSMFSYCTQLTNIPTILPATTLTTACYHGMFEGCENITSAPILPAPTLVEGCYCTMFAYCKNLTNITCLATNISAEYSTVDWLSYTSSTGTFTKAAGMNNWPTSTSGIPEGWTVQNYVD